MHKTNEEEKVTPTAVHTFTIDNCKTFEYEKIINVLE